MQFAAQEVALIVLSYSQTDLSFQCCLCVSACEAERGNEWIRLFNYLNTHTTQQEGQGGPVPPAEALQLSRRGIAPPPPRRPSRTRHSRAPGKETDFICFDHQPCSLTTQNRSLSHLHTPPGRLLRAPGPAGRAQLPPGLERGRSGAGAREGPSGTGHSADAGLQVKEGSREPLAPPLTHALLPFSSRCHQVTRSSIDTSGGGRTSCCKRTW